MATMESMARFGAGEVAVTVPTSQYGDAPRTVAFCAPILLGESDLVAALWLAENLTADELTDLDCVRDLVTDAFVNDGLEAVDEARCEIADLAPGTAGYAWLLQLQAAVRTAFAPVLSAPVGHALAGVA